jgi:chromosome segregation ATPase
MEQPFLASQLDYLEQKNQEAQSQIAKLQQRVELQEYQLQEQSHKIEALEDSLAQSRDQLVRNAPIEQQLSQFKEEILQFMEQQAARHQAATSNSNPVLLTQQMNNYGKALNDLRRDVEKTYRYEEQLTLLRTDLARATGETSRVQAHVEILAKHLEDRIKPLTQLEEQQRLNAHRTTELQAEFPEVHKKIESNLTKIQLVEQRIPQFSKYETALDGLREEMRRHREHMDNQVAYRERQLKNWTDLANSTERRLRENESLMEKYTEHYQLNKRALTSLQDFQESLQREQHRFGELQRLAEDRQRAEWEKFAAEYEQRWKKQSRELQPHFTDFQRNIDALQLRLNELTKLHKTVETQLNLLLRIVEEDIQARASAAAGWQERFEQIANGQA